MECEAVRFGCQHGVGGDHVRMAGARLITAQETENDLRESKIKSLTGGDEITGEPLNGVHIRFKPAGKIVMATHNRHKIRGGVEPR